MTLTSVGLLVVILLLGISGLLTSLVTSILSLVQSINRLVIFVVVVVGLVNALQHRDSAAATGSLTNLN